MTPHCTGPTLGPGPNPRHGTLLYRDPLLRPQFFQTCSNLFNLYLNVQGPSHTPPPRLFKFVHCEARTVGKRAVHTLLECFLVPFVFTSIFPSFVLTQEMLDLEALKTLILLSIISILEEVHDSRIFSRLTKCLQWLSSGGST